MTVSTTEQCTTPNKWIETVLMKSNALFWLLYSKTSTHKSQRFIKKILGEAGLKRLSLWEQVIVKIKKKQQFFRPSIPRKNIFKCKNCLPENNGEFHFNSEKKIREKHHDRSKLFLYTIWDMS